MERAPLQVGLVRPGAHVTAMDSRSLYYDEDVSNMVLGLLAVL